MKPFQPFPDFQEHAAAATARFCLFGGAPRRRSLGAGRPISRIWRHIPWIPANPGMAGCRSVNGWNCCPLQFPHSPAKNRQLYIAAGTSPALPLRSAPLAATTSRSTPHHRPGCQHPGTTGATQDRRPGPPCPTPAISMRTVPSESAVSRLQKDVSLSRELPAPGARLSRELSAPSAPGPTPRALEADGSAALRGLEADHSLDRSREHRSQTSQRRMALREHHSLDPSHRAGNTCHFEKASDNATVFVTISAIAGGGPRSKPVPARVLAVSITTAAWDNPAANRVRARPGTRAPRGLHRHHTNQACG